MDYCVYSLEDIHQKKAELKPGNFIVTHGTSLIDRCIELMTLSHWNHAALLVDATGTLIELEGSGIRKNHLASYPPEQIKIVDIVMSTPDREQVVAYAHYMLRKHARYGFLTTISILFKILTKSRLVIKLDGTLICSEFVAGALAQGGVIWDEDPSLITPGDLYVRFKKR